MMNVYRHVGVPWRMALVLAVAAIGNAALAAEDIQVSGSKVRWTATLPSGWVGGSAKQIEQVLAGTTNEMLRTIMGEMLLDAKKLDVFFTHTDVTGVTSGTLSSLRVNTVRLGMTMSDKDARKDLWQAFAQNLQKDFPQGSITTLSGDAVTTTGSRAAYEARFRTVQPNGSSVHVLMHGVELPDGALHLFTLKADSRKMPSREKDIRRLLASIRYH